MKRPVNSGCSFFLSAKAVQRHSRDSQPVTSSHTEGSIVESHLQFGANSHLLHILRSFERKDYIQSFANDWISSIILLCLNSCLEFPICLSQSTKAQHSLRTIPPFKPGLIHRPCLLLLYQRHFPFPSLFPIDINSAKCGPVRPRSSYRKKQCC